MTEICFSAVQVLSPYGCLARQGAQASKVMHALTIASNRGPSSAIRRLDKVIHSLRPSLLLAVTYHVEALAKEQGVSFFFFVFVVSKSCIKRKG